MMLQWLTLKNKIVMSRSFRSLSLFIKGGLISCFIALNWKKYCHFIKAWKKSTLKIYLLSLVGVLYFNKTMDMINFFIFIVKIIRESVLLLHITSHSNARSPGRNSRVRHWRFSSRISPLSGLLPGENLIVSFERHGSIDMGMIDAIIEHEVIPRL